MNTEWNFYDGQRKISKTYLHSTFQRSGNLWIKAKYEVFQYLPSVEHRNKPYLINKFLNKNNSIIEISVKYDIL